MFDNPFSNKRYLIIDDYGDMRSMMRSVLRLLSATDIDAASGGKDAVNLMSANQYDVILCDYHLGKGQDGQQVLEEARHRKLIKFSTIFIMTTAENTRDMVMAAIEYEPDSYLTKPFSKDLLKSRLLKLFEKKKNLTSIEAATQNKDYDQAMRLLAQLMAEKPKNLPELIRLKSNLYLDAGRLDEAEALLQQVLARRSVNWARLNLGRLYFKRKQYADAVETLSALIASQPSHILAYDWLAKAQSAQGDFIGSQNTLKAALQVSPNHIMRQKRLADSALKTRDFEVAERAYAKAKRLGKHSIYFHPSIFSGLARSQAALDRNDDALATIQDLSKTFPDKDATRFYAATAEASVRMHMGEEDAAKSCLKRAEETIQYVEQTQCNEFTLELATTVADLGDTDKADKLLQTAVRNNHDNDEFLQEVLSTYRTTGLYDDPSQLISELKQEIVALNNRGVSLLNAGNLGAAVVLFEKAAEGMSGNKTVNLNTAQALIMNMEKEGANPEQLRKTRRYIDRIQHIAPEDMALRKVQDRLRRLSLSQKS